MTPPNMSAESFTGWAVWLSPFSSRFPVVGRGGFEPPKAVPADLQSAPFGRSGTDPTYAKRERIGATSPLTTSPVTTSPLTTWTTTAPSGP